MNKKIQIAIVDDHKSLGESLASFLNHLEDIEVLFVAISADELFQKLKWKEKPSIILMDYALGEKDGEDCTLQVREQFGEEIKILGLSMHTDEGIIYKMIEAGADGFISKTESATKIAEAIRSVHTTGLYLDTKVSRILHAKAKKAIQQKGIEKSGYSSLNDQDIEIIKKICEGKNNEQVADEMFLSNHTINTYRKRILKKLKCSNTADLVVFAMRNGIFR